MKNIFLASLFVLMSSSVFAMPINTAPITSPFYVTVGDLDWAWASPVAAVNWGRNVLFTPDIQDGWRYATDIEWVARPDRSVFEGRICASQFWNSVYTHCDFSDSITNVLTGNSTDLWYVRGSEEPGGSVPVPATLALLGLGLMGLGWSRRKKV